MHRRAWYEGPVQLELTLYGPTPVTINDLNAYVGGVMDTLDGSHGPTFTYLPVVFQDDCQVTAIKSHWVESRDTRYEVKIVFLRNNAIHE